MNTLFFIILAIVVIEAIASAALTYLNLQSLSPDLPDEAKGIYDQARYKKSQEYSKANIKLSLISSMVSFIALLLVLFYGGFGFLDSLVSQWSESPLVISLLFFASLGILLDIFNLPFSLYQTFVIEEKFGFNRTTLKTYFIDKLKGYLLIAIFGGSLFAMLAFAYQQTGSKFWLLAWAVLSVFSLGLTFLYTTVIVPLFNKLTPLPDGALKNAIQEYSKKVNFDLSDLLVMDSSKRSNKANAFFSGFGKQKKVVLFDTLVEKHSTEELVAVLAHEIGHYKKKHVIKGLIFGLLQTGFMLWVLSIFLANPESAIALGAKHNSFHLSLVAFSLLYTPLASAFGIFSHMLSRKNEFEADNYAKTTYSGNAMIDALRKLSSENLSNLTPHPAYVFVHYSHPPVLERIKALQT